eukprot:624864-Amorphochlora_amoeboformis.AAC.1
MVESCGHYEAFLPKNRDEDTSEVGGRSGGVGVLGWGRRSRRRLVIMGVTALLALAVAGNL